MTKLSEEQNASLAELLSITSRLRKAMEVVYSTDPPAYLSPEQLQAFMVELEQNKAAGDQLFPERRSFSSALADGAAAAITF